MNNRVISSDIMKLRCFKISIICLTLVACKGDRNSIASPTSQDQKVEISKKQDLPFLDTTIFLSEIQNASIAEKGTSKNEAETLLYTYYKTRGVRSVNDSKPTSQTSKEELYVTFDKLYPFKSNYISGAVVSYWLGPRDLNGHCFQPRKAVILNTKDGIKFTNENFIPINFTLDSVVGTNIYGYEYECGGMGTIKHFQVRINK